ncbi:MAG: 3-deoxy-7-phosphoheptulonate synthase [Candidatus Cloacimonetes bacterium]|nr:3-deoxy-7-phosphoheptulonate synthase [Candidatus Cloacimonadota bacterium]
MCEFKKSRVISIGEHKIGGDNFTVIAGPCTIENYQDLKTIALQLKKLGIAFFRGGAFKMRTSPHSFPGLGKEGLEIIKKVADETGMLSVSEIISPEDVELLTEYVDIIQVGTRSMHNYPLLSKLGKVKNPIILKRGMSSTYEEWLLAAEHISSGGNENIILCERGIRTFDYTYTRNSLDISAVPVMKQLTDYPIIIDPSHSGGRRDLVRPLAWAGAAAGADGLLLETHFCPDETVCDSQQTVDLQELELILAQLPQLAALWNKKIPENI